MSSKSSSYVYEKGISAFHGVDLSRDPSDRREGVLAFAVNMYRDHEGGGGGIETVPGYRKIAATGRRIHAIHRHPSERETLLLHCGTRLYTYDLRTRDGGGIPVQVKNGVLAARESHAATEGNALYLTDGAHYAVLRDGVLAHAATSPYIPTVRSDGEAYEEINLLTDMVREKYHLYDLSRYAYRTTEGIICTVDHNGVCLVSGYTGSDTRLSLPTEMEVGGRTYAVTGVAADAFRENTTVRELIVPDGYTHLGVGAFSGMGALHTVVLPASVEEIPAYCFRGSAPVVNLYLAEGIKKCNASALYGATLYNVYYSGDAMALMQMEGYEAILPPSPPADRQMRYFTRYEPVSCQFHLPETVCAVLSATLDGKEVTDRGDVTCVPHTVEDAALGARVDYVVLSAPNEIALFGKAFSLTLRYADVLGKELRARYPAFSGSGADAVNGCRLITRFDGRFFLSGNPALPGLVLYTGRRPSGVHEPLYVGCYDYFIDGDGATEVTALLPTARHLLVLTATPTNGPTVFRHAVADTEDRLLPRIYPVSEELGERGCLGAALLFLDDPLYLSGEGLEAVEPVTLSLSTERRLAHRSAAVDARLCRDPLESARLFRFGSYVGIATEGGNVYLADGYERMQGNRSAPYEWYCLCDVGEYTGQGQRYRYASAPLPQEWIGATIPTASGGEIPLREPTERGGAVDGLTVYSATVNAIPLTYVIRDGAALPVETDGERYGGEFHGISAILEVDGLLCFGTDAGGLFAVNTDKRGADGRLSAEQYSFNGRAYLSAIATQADDGGMPTLRKSTVRGGAVRMKAMPASRVRVLCSVDGEPYREADRLFCGRHRFSETDFSAASYADVEECVLPLRAGARRYATLSLLFASEEYQRPFGILSLAYRYRAAGRI